MAHNELENNATIRMEKHFGYPSKKVSGEFTLYDTVEITIKKGKGSRKWDGVEATIIFIDDDGKMVVMAGNLTIAFVSANQVKKI